MHRAQCTVLGARTGLQGDGDAVIPLLVDLVLVVVKLLHLLLGQTQHKDTVHLLRLGGDALETLVVLEGGVVLLVELQDVVPA